MLGAVSVWAATRWRPIRPASGPGGAQVVRTTPAQVSPGEAERQLLASVIGALSLPVIVLDAQVSLLTANPAARALLGDALMAVLRHPALRAGMARLDASGPVSIEITLDVPVPRQLQLRLSRLPQDLGDGLVSAVVEDQSQPVALERMRADFVANASHELRTPLASLIGFIDTLLGPARDDVEAQRRFLGIMAGQANRMRRLIDNLLSLSRVQMVEHQRPSARVAVGAVCVRVAAELAPLFEARGQVLHVEVTEDAPDILADADQIAQVVQNLLDNASKYGDAGGTVWLSFESAPAGGAADAGWPSQPGVVIRVRDDGPGIDERHLPRLTERFYRVEGGQDPRGGSGLGLAIVKHIVGRHRGRLSIDSRPGQGATFSVWLPR